MSRTRTLSWEALHDCTTLAQFAPRLARARDQLVEQRWRQRQERRWLRDQVLESERVLAHRELQLIRAGATRSGWRIRRRTRLLAEIREQLATYRKLLAEAEREAA
jgi:hypothetical protein